MRFSMHPPAREYRITGSHLCSAGTGGDWANGCERVALPGFDLCPWHEDWSKYLESQVMDEYENGEWEPTTKYDPKVDYRALLEEAGIPITTTPTGFRLG